MKKINKKGFTLVELLAVIVVLAILATVAITNVWPLMNKARLGTQGDSLISIIKNGFQTCALSQTDTSTISSTCTENEIKTNYISNYKGTASNLSVTQSNIRITYVENGNFKIVIPDMSYSDAITALAKIKDYYVSNRTTYTWSTATSKWTASN